MGKDEVWKAKSFKVLPSVEARWKSLLGAVQAAPDIKWSGRIISQDHLLASIILWLDKEIGEENVIDVVRRFLPEIRTRCGQKDPLIRERILNSLDKPDSIPQDHPKAKPRRSGKR